MENRNGGPAFPVVTGADTEGMTLLDWFAGQALIGLLADNRYNANRQTTATDAYSLARAMLEAKEADGIV